MPAFQLILSLGLLPFAGKVIPQFFTSQIGVSGAPGATPGTAGGGGRPAGGCRWPQRPNNIMSSLFVFEVDPERPSPVRVRLHLSILIPIKLACSFANPIYLFSIPLCFNLLSVD